MVGFAVSGIAAHMKIAAREILHELEAERIVPAYGLRLPAESRD
jgi:hypothetical protein